MTKIMCNCIACKHNPSNIYETYGECTLDEVKVKDEEYFGNDSGGFEPEWFDKCVCQGFEWHVGKELTWGDKTIKTGVKNFTTRGDE